MATVESKAYTILKHAKMFKCPVDVEKLADFYSIYIIKEDMDDHVSGLCYTKNDKEFVGVNSAHSPKRQRFTIAHEIGHLILHFPKNEDVIIDTDKTTTALFHRAKGKVVRRVYEKEANQFAAALLMPEELLIEALESQSDDDEVDISNLADDFEVSEQAMTYRLLNLDLISY